MPLKPGVGNIGNNIAEMEKAGHKRSQSIAAALRVAGKHRAMGGITQPDFFSRGADRQLTHSGPINLPIGGRTDHVPMNVAGGSYVVPADVVSHLGQGNTMAGNKIMGRMFSSGPYGMSMPGMSHAKPKFADGGAASSSVPIVAAGGEYVLTPSEVSMIGGGDLKKGHETLDAWVLHERQKHIKTLRKLPPPKKR